VSQEAVTADLDFARKLIRHNCWEDARVWRLAIAPLSDAQFVQATPFGLGTIQRECWRLMESQSTCLQRIGGRSFDGAPALPDSADRKKMQRQWEAIHAGWSQLASELDAALFFSDCTFADGDRDVTLKVWQLIFDVIYQGSTHRSDIMRMVAEVHEPPAFDLSLMQYLTGVFRQ